MTQSFRELNRYFAVLEKEFERTTDWRRRSAILGQMGALLSEMDKLLDQESDGAAAFGHPSKMGS